MNEIRGEYWINHGHTEFADGDVGEENHESIATQYIISKYLDNIKDLADYCGIEMDLDENYIDPYQLADYLQEIAEYLSDEGVKDPVKAIIDHIGSKDAYLIFIGKGVPHDYVMKYEGWIAIRKMNIDLFGYDDQKRKSLLSGLQQIFDEEGIDETIPPEDFQFGLYDYRTKKSQYITLRDIEEPQIAFRPTQPNTNIGHGKFTVTSQDNQENRPNKTIGTPNPYNQMAQKLGMILPSQQLWRTQSESFKDWIANQ